MLLLSLCPINTKADIQPRIYAIQVVIKESYRNHEVVDTEWYTIETYDKSDAIRTAIHDRTENGNGNIYYCYGHKYGYCNIS